MIGLIVLFSIFCFCISSFLYAVTLSSDYERIGYVDIKRVFDEFPKKQKTKQKLEEKINLKKEEIKRQKEEIEKQKEEIKKLKENAMEKESTEFKIEKNTITLQGVQIEKNEKDGKLKRDKIQEKTSEFKVEQDTATVKTIYEQQMHILQKEKALKEFIKKAGKEINSLDREYTEVILGIIYEAVKKVGREQGISMIFDKREVLYGKEVLDITDKVLERLKKQ